MEDEEGVQGKAWNFLLEVGAIRGMMEPEMAHPWWNSYKRAAKQTGLDSSILKLTILCNHPHGSFQNGDRFFTRRDLADF